MLKITKTVGLKKPGMQLVPYGPNEIKKERVIRRKTDLAPRGIPTLAVASDGSQTVRPGIYASGRRARPTGFGTRIAVTTAPIGRKQVIADLKIGPGFW